jgi:hypothetical protein
MGSDKLCENPGGKTVQSQVITIFLSSQEFTDSDVIPNIITGAVSDAVLRSCGKQLRVR